MWSSTKPNTVILTMQLTRLRYFCYSTNFNMIHIGRQYGKHIETCQTAILTTISNLLYVFCVTRLNTKYLFISEVNYYYCKICVILTQNNNNAMCSGWLLHITYWPKYCSYTIMEPGHGDKTIRWKRAFQVPDKTTSRSCLLTIWNIGLDCQQRHLLLPLLNGDRQIIGQLQHQSKYYCILRCRTCVESPGAPCKCQGPELMDCCTNIKYWVIMIWGRYTWYQPFRKNRSKSTSYCKFSKFVSNTIKISFQITYKVIVGNIDNYFRFRFRTNF